MSIAAGNPWRFITFVDFPPISADQGNAAAQFNSRVLLEYGNNTSINKSLAGHDCGFADEQGYAVAQFNCGVLLEYGNDVSINKSPAAYYSNMRTICSVAPGCQKIIRWVSPIPPKLSGSSSKQISLTVSLYDVAVSIQALSPQNERSHCGQNNHECGVHGFAIGVFRLESGQSHLWVSPWAKTSCPGHPCRSTTFRWNSRSNQRLRHPVSPKSSVDLILFIQCEASTENPPQFRRLSIGHHAICERNDKSKWRIAQLPGWLCFGETFCAFADQPHTDEQTISEKTE
jgi:hypothetical protein